MELRNEINRIISTLPQAALEEVYQLLTELEKIDSKNLNRAAYIKKILNEDKSLLTRLAQ